MGFDLKEATAVLARTPAALDALLGGLPEAWIRANEGPETWSVFDVIGHLAHGERTDWIPRVEHLLAHGEAQPFPPFDRFAQLRESEGKSLPMLLGEFAVLRTASLRRLEELDLRTADLERRGCHPAFGPVTLGQLLATWVTHDLDHVAQIARVMARRNTEAVGPWREYLRIVRDAPRA